MKYVDNRDFSWSAHCFYKKTIILLEPQFLNFPKTEPEIFLKFYQLLLKQTG